MTKMKVLTQSLFMSILIGCSSIFAQTPQQESVTDEEVKLFATVYKEIQVINQRAQQTMIAAIEDEGIEIQRFNEIFQARQMPGQQVELAEDELEKFENASREIEKIQATIQLQMEEKIVELGLTPERYQEIGKQIQSSPELQSKIQEYL
jgi:hypothetical protein